MYFMESDSNDSGWNLAVEEFLADKLQKGESCLFLWQNANTIVVGKNQNTIAQINSDFVAANSILVRRRLSGGGAVYHDLGNLCFTWITDAHNDYQIDFSEFCQPVIAAIRKLGVEAELSGRNDILVCGKKISGNAQYFHKGKVVHHGTILFDSDLTVLAQALRVDPQKVCDKGIASVSSRVANLQEFIWEGLTIAEFKKILVDHIFEKIPMEYLRLSFQDQQDIAALKQQRYDTWEWNYGKSPAYCYHERIRIAGCGTVEVHTNVKQGVIQDIRIMGDYFENRSISELESMLVGCPASRADVEEMLRHVDVNKYISNMDNLALAKLIAPI